MAVGVKVSRLALGVKGLERNAGAPKGRPIVENGNLVTTLLSSCIRAGNNHLPLMKEFFSGFNNVPACYVPSGASRLARPIVGKEFYLILAEALSFPIGAHQQGVILHEIAFYGKEATRQHGVGNVIVIRAHEVLYFLTDFFCYRVESHQGVAGVGHLNFRCFSPLTIGIDKASAAFFSILKDDREAIGDTNILENICRIGVEVQAREVDIVDLLVPEICQALPRAMDPPHGRIDERREAGCKIIGKHLKMLKYIYNSLLPILCFLLRHRHLVGRVAYNSVNRRTFCDTTKKKQGNMVKSFGQQLRSEALSDNTIAAYLYAVEDFGRKYPCFNRENLLLYKAEQMERFKPKTVNLRIQALNKYLAFIGKPRLRLKSLRIQQRTYLENVISDADYQYLKSKLKAEEDEVWYFLVRFLGATGARVSELVQFKAEHVRAGHLDLYTKGGKVRRIFIPHDLSIDAQAWLVRSNIESGHVFLDNRGKQITPRAIRHKLQRFAHLWGINPKVMHPHSFRHRYAKNFLEAFNDIALLADLMGHESIETTRIYLRRTAGEQQAIVDKVITW